MNSDILILCDGGGGYGLGHVTRCVALAEELAARGYAVGFVINGEARVREFECVNAAAAQWPELARDAVCVVDSYAMQSADIERVWQAAGFCLWVDDECRRAYPGGLAVSPSLYGDELDYGIDALAGKDYIILREDFRRRFDKTINREVRELTVIMGGTDAAGLVPGVLAALDGIECRKNVISAVQGAAFGGAYFCSALSAQEVAGLFLRSDIVISAGGQTLNELIQLNTPTVLIEAAENQRRNIAAAVKRGLAVEYKPGGNLRGIIHGMDFDARLRMSMAMEGYDFSGGVGNIVDGFLRRLKEQLI